MSGYFPDLARVELQAKFKLRIPSSAKDKVMTKTRCVVKSKLRTLRQVRRRPKVETRVSVVRVSQVLFQNLDRADHLQQGN